ncbi:hypothetical protein CH366_11685 [Leptospira harrisiae]|uniref:Uncharacterized protein n=1 Tax=Leptospira harrisiae TaxID=2023189 RepID=A0A2N0AJ76_9LEPT|nr:hypothetical protein CH364_09985 [Leptospira harrisiae]PKA07095.1 hypothetical protein CH366_11685 [Leptospira harrisiae]
MFHLCYIVGYLISYLIILIPSMSELDPCTNGIPDGFLTSIYLIFYILISFSLLVLPFVKISSKYWFFGLLHIVTFAYFSFKLTNYIYFVSLKGYHICDGYHLWNDFTNPGNESYGKSDLLMRLFPLFLFSSLFYFISITYFSKSISKKNS